MRRGFVLRHDNDLREHVTENKEDPHAHNRKNHVKDRSGIMIVINESEKDIARKTNDEQRRHPRKDDANKKKHRHIVDSIASRIHGGTNDVRQIKNHRMNDGF